MARESELPIPVLQPLSYTHSGEQGGMAQDDERVLLARDGDIYSARIGL